MSTPLPSETKREKAAYCQQKQEARAFGNGEVARQIEKVKGGDHAFKEEKEHRDGEYSPQQKVHRSSAGSAAH